MKPPTARFVFELSKSLVYDIIGHKGKSNIGFNA
jgi:hypothetical protein